MRAELERLETTLTKHLDTWIPKLGLSTWTPTIAFNTVPSRVGYRGAEVQVAWEYKRFTIDFYLPTLSKHYTSPLELERCVVHELCHVLVSGMSRDPASDSDLLFEERTVVELTAILLNLSRPNPSTRKPKNEQQ